MLVRTESLRLDRVQDHPASTGFPANHPPMTSFLGVPIVYRARNIGDIYLCDKDNAQPFGAGDQLAVEALAGVAAVAITNAYQFLQVNEELEHRRQELDDANRTLKGLSDRMLWALESERRVIAQELHDGLGQSLAAAGIAADAIIEERGAVKENAVRLRSILRDAVADVRRITYGLRPTMLDELGPVAAVRDVVEQLDNEGGTRVEFETRGSARRLPEPIETVIFRVAQEALTNALRHGRAKGIRTELIFEPSRVVLRVTDNGIGMPALLAEQGLGIAGMRERAALVGAQLEIESRPGHGVVVTLDLPSE
jgi:signal transduction histidine kinase